MEFGALIILVLNSMVPMFLSGGRERGSLSFLGEKGSEVRGGLYIP